MTQPSWHELWNAHFTKIAKHEIPTWDDILSRKFNNLKSEEICSAVTAVAEKKRRGELKFADIDQLITAIIKGRYDARNAQARFNPDVECAYCYGGILVYGISIKRGSKSVQKVIGLEKHKNEGWGEGSESCPCLCSMGAQRMQSGYPTGDHEKMRAHAKKVMIWLDKLTAKNPLVDLPFDRNLKGDYEPVVDENTDSGIRRDNDSVFD